MKRKKNNSPYSDPYTYGRNTSFDQHISELDDLSGFRTAQDYANEHTPGNGNRNRQVYERIPSAGRTISPGMMKIAAVGAVIAILGVIGACGGFQWLTKGISNVASLITVAFLMTLLCWGVLCLIGNDWIYGQRKKYLFGILFAINIISMTVPGQSQLGTKFVFVIAAVLLFLRLFII